MVILEKILNCFRLLPPGAPLPRTMLVAEARVAFGDARDLVLKALDNVRDSIPRSVPFQVLHCGFALCFVLPYSLFFFLYHCK